MAQRQSEYNRKSTQEVSVFLGNLKTEGNKGGVFDSAASVDFVNTAINQNTGVAVPENLKIVFSEASQAEQAKISRALLDSAEKYKRDHGVDAPADLMEQVIHSAFSTTKHAQALMDSTASATSLQSTDALQSNRAVVAILATASEAIPFAHYLPADIKSNQAKLAILQHVTGSKFGLYADGALLDGAHSGDRYISASREDTLTNDGNGGLTGAITTIQSNDSTCDKTANAVKLLRGRSILYINGRVAAREYGAQGSGASSVSGSIVLDGVTYAIAGTINTDTGVIALTTSPALPTTHTAVMEAFVDYERDTDLTPSVITEVDTFDLFATPWRVLTRQSIDSRTQMSNELGLDPYSEGLIAINAQFSNERHYEVLRKAKRLAANNTDTYDFNWSATGDFKLRADVWHDFSSVLGSVSQTMALLTMNHGITHLYVGQKVAAQLRGLPNDIWQPSGITERAGIYRLGRLYGQYDVYYTPKVVSETTNAAEILCVGQATDVTRNPFVLGDAVAPTVIPLAVNSDLKTGAAYYARNFTAVNPHPYSSMGCALINVTNLF